MQQRGKKTPLQENVTHSTQLAIFAEEPDQK